MTREALHRMIDQLPESELERTGALFEAARTHNHAFIQALLAQEEPLEPGDLEALAEVDREDTLTADEVDHHFGLA
jgi:hypothetical protein